MSYIYFWGRPIIQQLQKSSTKSNISCIQTNQVIEQVSCGLEHAFLLTETNEVYGMGSNLQGQCGAGYLKDTPIYKIIIPAKSKIVSISCGWYHTVILDQLGCVFTAGSGSQGATGQGNRQNSYTFKQIMTGVRKISAGMDHNLVIKGNKVFGWGNNDYGQLGLHTKKNYLSPQQLNTYPCNQLCAGTKYSIFVTVKGVYGCGLNNNYQLGLGHEKNVSYPKALNIDQQIQKVYCGNYCVGRTKSQQWYMWGSGAFGVFKYPTKANFFQSCEKVSLSVSFGMMLRNDKIYVWGSNNYGQLGSDYDDMKDYAHESCNLSELRLSQFCCGVNFGIGISHEERLSNTNDYETESNTIRQTQFNNRNNQNRQHNKRQDKSIKTYYNPNKELMNYQKMRTVYTDYQSRNKYQKPQKSYHHTRNDNSRLGASNFVYSNHVDQQENIYNKKAQSDEAKKRKTMPTFSHNNNESSSLHQYTTKQPIYLSQHHKLSKPNLNKGIQKQESTNSKQQKTQNSIKKQKKNNNQSQTIYINQNHHNYPSSQNQQDDNKQNWQNIQKLRKIMNQQKQQSFCHSSSSSNRQQKLIQQKKNQQYQKEFEEYGHNLQRLKKLLEEAKIEKQLSSSSQQRQ